MADDPWGAEMDGAEWAVVGVITFFYSVTLIACGIIAYYRNYPPLKVKQVELVLLSVFSGIIWVIGAFAALRVFPQQGHPVFLVCTLWGIWFQTTFGVYLWVCVVIFRFWRLFTIVRLRRSASTLQFKATFLFFWGPAILWGIVSSALEVNGPSVEDGILRCEFRDWAKYLTLALMGVYALLLFYFSISLRNIKQKYLNEYKETRNTLLFFVFIYIMYTIILAVRGNDHPWGRLLGSILASAAPLITFWTIVSVPLYHCLFNHEEYERAFKDTLRMVSSNSNAPQAPPGTLKSNSATAPDTNLSQSGKEDTLSRSVSQLEMN